MMMHGGTVAGLDRLWMRHVKMLTVVTACMQQYLGQAGHASYTEQCILAQHIHQHCRGMACKSLQCARGVYALGSLECVEKGTRAIVGVTERRSLSLHRQCRR